MTLDDMKAKLKIMDTHYDQMVSTEYIEPPIDIWTFLTDNKYLGKSTENGNAIFPVWKDALVATFGEIEKTTVVLTGSVRTGKTTIAVYGIAYIMYQLLNLKFPWNYFGLTQSNKMAVIFFNLSKTLGGSRGYSKLKSCRM